MTLQQLKEEARKQLLEINSYPTIKRPFDVVGRELEHFIDSLITKAYEEGKEEIENELKQEIIKGRKVKLYGEDYRGTGVEGYNIGEEYEVDEVRIKPNYGIQVFLKGNVHAYPVTSFYNLTKKQ